MLAKKHRNIDILYHNRSKQTIAQMITMKMTQIRSSAHQHSKSLNRNVPAMMAF
ncbi:unnamed protein product [Anisakis simplex]|uniref:Uncharacterized protein n=1 Tax=Anisakis simplex TaxID=6269 RepID=A0A0M3JHA1_ANISI|nr:unnamed protein product [Anisakis simplex]